MIGIKFRTTKSSSGSPHRRPGYERGYGILKPRLIETGVEPIGTVVLGTVKGDLHDIGKNLVRMMFEGSGLTVHDLGVDVSAGALWKPLGYKQQIVGMSAYHYHGQMKATIEAIKAAGLRDQVNYGRGAPVTAKFAQEVEADVYAKDAAKQL